MTQRLSDRIHQLGDALGAIIAELSGQRTLELVEQIRGLAKAHRSGDDTAARALSDLVASLSPQDAYEMAMAFTTYFELVNLAEEDHRTRILRERRAERAKLLAAEAGPGATLRAQPIRESIEAAVVALRDAGATSEQVQQLLDQLSIELVFTAHPTESKRRTILSKLQRIGELLRRASERADAAGLSPSDDWALVADDVRREIAGLWLTDRSRTAQPLAQDEARTGLFYFSSTLWDALPQLQRDLDSAVGRHFPDVATKAGWLTFGSWIGGDRDGNPNITAQVTADTLNMHRRTALEKHRDATHELSRRLSVSRRRDGVSAELQALIEKAVRDTSHGRNVAERYPNEPYRAIMAALTERLSDAWQNTLDVPLYAVHDVAPPAVIGADELAHTLDAVTASLREGRSGSLSEGELQTLAIQARIFGLHTASLDLRQHSEWHQVAVADVLGTLARLSGSPPAADYATLSEAAKIELLTRALEGAKPLALERFGLFTTDTMRVVEPMMVAREAMSRYGPDALGIYIISMTDNVSDALEVLLLMRWCGIAMDIAPLFETRDDLERAPDILRAMFAHAEYRRHLRARGDQQYVMLGYSDSNKDCGYVAANWALYEAQESIASTCDAAEILYTLFHGRGGSVARGGGPAARAILAQPAGLRHGRIRITEQGEVLSTRYLNPDIAHRHLEQVAHGVMLASFEAGRRDSDRPAIPDEWREAMRRMSSRGFEAYEMLVERDSDFIAFWRAATPIDEIGALKLASRPAFRRATKTVADLRAIPWVFSWMQSRFNFPGWFGLGSALEGELSQGETARARLQAMYRGWPFFQTMIDNAQQSLTKADMGIASVYSSLVPDVAVRERVFGLIRAEFDRAERAILTTTGQSALLDNEPTLQRSIQLRNPYIDPLNYIQVEMIRRLRQPGAADRPDAAAMRDVVELTINGLSSGLRNTG